MPYYVLKYDPMGLLSDVCETAIGKRPVITSKAGSDILALEFDPDLTAQERQAVLRALPEWFRAMWRFSRHEGTLGGE